jgi:hypothetical protein
MSEIHTVPTFSNDIVTHWNVLVVAGIGYSSI